MPDSFITRCPNCKTCFRVGAAQLAPRAGQVRCGRCAFVFAAPEHRIETDVGAAPGVPPVPAPAPAPEPATHTAAAPATDVANATAIDAGPVLACADAAPEPPRQYELPLEPNAEAPAAEPTSTVGLSTQPDIAAEFVQQASAVQPDAGPAPSDITDESTATTDGGTAATAEAVLADAAPADVKPAEAQPADAQPADAAALLTDYQVGVAGKNTGVDFTAKPLPLFQPPPRRRHSWAWALGAVLLAILAVGQVAREYRGDLLLSHPAWRPYLQLLCDYSHCTLTLPRKIEFVTIEASDLLSQPENPRYAVLNAVLRNRAGYTMALPKLELALTDAQEQAMVRRAITPAEYLPRVSAGTEPAIAAGQEIAVRVNIDLREVQAAGYRVAVFY